MKPAVLHIIDSLGIGGAETLLVNANVKLKGYQHIVVYLNGSIAYEEQLQNISTHCLHFSGWVSLIPAILKLRKLLRQYQVKLIHSHLYYSTIIARLACPESMSLISTYHSLLHDPANKAQYGKKLLWLDRLTYRTRFHTLFVSQAVQQLVCSKVCITQNYEVLYNFVEDQYYDTVNNTDTAPSTVYKIVMLGNLRPEKNYALVMQTLAQLASTDIQIDIFGDGGLRKQLEELISSHELEAVVKLRGRTAYPYQALPNYDLYLAASKFEGFGVALAEAMAVGMPCLVSEIPAHKEVGGDVVIYFDPDSVASLKENLKAFTSGMIDLEKLKSQIKQRAKKFQKSTYLDKLTKIYEKQLAND